MNKIAFILAAVATLALAGTAQAKLDRKERAAWRQTVQSQSYARPAASGVVEGRNAAVRDRIDSVQGVEPYIANTIKLNARSER